MSNKILSKSRLLKGFQCPKSLMLSIFEPELEGEPDEAQENIFNEGKNVGELARKEFAGGTLIEAEHFDFDSYTTKTIDAIKSGEKVLYEAGFRWKSFFFRSDILKKAPKDSWDLIEVKMSNSSKPVHLIDLAIQRIIMEGAGYKIRKTILMHLNRECVFPDLSDLFIQEDKTEEVEAILADTKKKMLSLEKLVATKKTPKIDIGTHCEDPYPCGFIDHCWKNVPKPSVFDIPKIKPWKHYSNGVVTIKDLAKEPISEEVKIFVICHLKKKQFIDKEAIRSNFNNWKWPLIFIDFETISFTIPRLNGTSPYSQVPFQLACSIWNDPKAKPLEKDFLDVNAEDPRERMAKHLADNIPSKGSVVAYNKGFESGVLKRLAEVFPKYERKMTSIRERLVDPLNLLRGNVYDPKFGSSYSLKYVAPALLGKTASYDGMKVGDGTAAQLAYIKLRDPKVTTKEKNELTEALIIYCRKDAELMRLLIDWLMKQIK